MGLTAQSVGMHAVDTGFRVERQFPEERVIAIAGNPNVGKSTVFNGLTGMNQHTGNWPGKTVSNAVGRCRSPENVMLLVDIPGTYSLFAHSKEEEVARDFLCFGEPDAVVVVCDATCLERNLNLVLQTIEISKRVIVCVNLMDEAARKQISVDLDGLSRTLGVPVVGTVARDKRSLINLLKAIDASLAGNEMRGMLFRYEEAVEQGIERLSTVLMQHGFLSVSPRFLAMRLLRKDAAFLLQAEPLLKIDPLSIDAIQEARDQALIAIEASGIPEEKLEEHVVSSLIQAAEAMAQKYVRFEKKEYNQLDRRLDRILTGRRAGFPVMILFLCLILFITITGANVPSELLSKTLFSLETPLKNFLSMMHMPDVITGALVDGAYRVLAWVVAVMLPPMAIFFPLFTLLEDAGYLPRIAYNLDRPFQRCSACGKQALTMCMGFGCNAAGIVGCRIIDSPRERLIAILTNNFVPCNGRFPTLISIITMFFLGAAAGFVSSLLGAVLLTAAILIGISVTFFASWLLSKSILKGVPSSFALELPPYRRPQIGRVIVRSMMDRTLFVLGRAAAVAAPAGLILYILANVAPGGICLISRISTALDPFGRLMGLDGVILLAFILGLPANEIVFPIIIMAYLSRGSLMKMESLSALRTLLVENGWTWKTAISMMLFSLLHWPCSTTLMTIKKETGSIKWTIAAFLLPTILGIVLLIVLNCFFRLFV